MLKKILSGFVGLMMFAGTAWADEQADARRWHDGLYVGFGIGQTLNVGGGMTAPVAYQQQTGLPSDMFPRTTFEGHNVRPLQVSIGKAINDNLRVEASYTNYLGLSFSEDPAFLDELGSSDVAMLNVYYNLDSIVGSFIDGKLRPYVGAGIGMSVNAMSGFSHINPYYYGAFLPFGSTTRSLAYALEAGLTHELGNGLSFDFFARWMNLGSLNATGDVMHGVEQTPVPGSPGFYDVTYQRDNWRESGTLSVLDMGVRLRLMF